MKQGRIKNTSRTPNPEWLMGANPDAIIRQEKQGQQELVNSTQLPLKLNDRDKTDTALVEYAKMGIIVTGWTKVDELFGTFILPKGWKKVATDHDMYVDLVDDKGRVRASIFYKASFYDRKADIRLNRRFNIHTVNYLPQNEKGHYEKQTVKVINPKFKEVDGMDDNGFVQFRDGIVRHYSEPRFIKEVQDVWIPKYKDHYEETNNTPHYFELTDCKKVIFSTQKDPVYFRTKYKKENHEKWWADYDHITNRMRTQATIRLNELYPDWENVHAYWD